MGYCIEKQVQMGYKVVSRRSPKEAAGVVCVRDGKIDYVEYSEIPDAVATLVNPETNELLFNAANILNLFFETKFVRKIADRPSLMEYHIAKKKIPYINDNGEVITPPQPNGWKFEKFVLDCTPHANNSVAVMMVRREEEFALIKNGWESTEDSPISARHMLAAEWKRQVELLGGTVLGVDEQKICEVSSCDRIAAETTCCWQNVHRPLPYY